MATYPAIYAASMTDQQRAVYYAELSVVQKDEVLGVLLAVFLGTFGAHHFYMRRTGLGILYCVLSVTGFSTIAGFIEAFFMPERIRRFNAAQAAAIAGSLGFYPAAAPAVNVFPGPGTQGLPVQSYGAWPNAAPACAAGPAANITPTLCPSCSTPVAPGVKFCARCGAAVDTPANLKSNAEVQPQPESQA